MFTDTDIIHAYTRAQAIEDGDLVDVTETAREAGFTVPVALTRAVWLDCVEWSDEDNRRKRTANDEDGRLWDVVYMAAFAGKRSPAGVDLVPVELYRVPREGKGRQPRRVELFMHIGPGDAGEPVITVMQPGDL